jgi:hypothetical protein
MDARRLKALLRRYRAGEVSEASALRALADLPYEDLGFARVDHHRSLRCGNVEVVLGQGKEVEHVVAIARALRAKDALALVTRTGRPVADALAAELPGVVFHERAAAVTIGSMPRGEGLVAVVSAGTSDGRVVAEAALTARCVGARVETFEDVGVAGIHRLMAIRPRLRLARAVVVAAGMEGALPSVVAGLVEAPVIAVPTSVGYGASFGGVAALLAMLSSCAAGVSVVNIDNGFGAGYQAAMINRRRRPA